MLDKIIHFSISNKFIVGLFTLALIIWGAYSLSRLPIDALPDITNNQVQIITLSPSLAAQEVEQFITYPIEQAVKPIPKIIELRSISRFGLSVITVVFEEKVDVYWARAQISERIREAENVIPEGMGTPEMAPISTGLGEIYQYTIAPKSGYEDEYSAMQLRTIQDWIVKPQLTGTPGVAEINTLGGFLKQYEIAIQPDKLKSMNTTVPEIFEALERNNQNTGGAYIDKKPYAYFIRGIGMASSISDIEKIVVKNEQGIPILVRDIATVQEGYAIRYGAATKDGKGEIVSAMVMMLKGENSAEVVTRVKERIDQIKKSLPEGVVIEPFLDRSKLVNNAISTVQRNLIEGALIVIFILVLLIGNVRAGLIVASVIPLALLFAVSMMNLFGVSGNLMSLGAIDFGLIVDGAVIIVEAIVHRIQGLNQGRLTGRQMDEQVYAAASKIRNSAAFGEIIILIVYLPILALVGIEGKMFRPMAETVGFAILGAFILSLTYVPMMSALLLKKDTGHKRNISDKIMDFLHRIYDPALNAALRLRVPVIAISVLLLVAAGFIFSTLGGEFIPTLEEGDIATHVISSPGSSLSQEVEAATKAEQILMKKFPEVTHIVTKIGSAEVPTDPMPMEAGDAIISMKDKDEWTSAETKEEMMEKMEEALDEIPGITTEFSQPIQMRFNELMTGVRSDVAVKIFGEDIDLLASKAEEALGIIRIVEGVIDARAEQVTGLPQITVRYNHDKLALYGLSVGDLNKVVRTGFAGEAAGSIYEGEKRFDLVVRLVENSRQDIRDIKTLFITLPSGNQIPLEQVADVQYEQGPMQISREDGKRRIVIGFNVRGSDVQTVVDEIQQRLDKNLKLPAGYYITYGGQFENLVEANKRLAIAVPIALALIFLLLFFTFRSIKQSLLIFTAIPFSAIGGVIALWLRGMPFSISAGIGFIALFGVAVLNGIVLISYFNQLKSEGISDIVQRVKEGTRVRLRPVIMTAAVASLGFLPMAISNSSGAEVQKPLATVVIGGLITATLLTLIVLPILYIYFEKINIMKRGSDITTGLVIFLLINPIVSFGQNQPQLTLDLALQQGLKNNNLVQASELNVQVQQQLKVGSFEMPQTELNATLGQINSHNFDQNYSVTQGLPNPALIAARKKLLNANIAISENSLRITKQELTNEIRQSWLRLSYLHALNDLLSREDSIMKEFVRGADLRYQTGETNMLEKTTVETKRQQLLQNFKQNEVLISIEEEKLKRYIGIDSFYGTYDFAPADLAALQDSSLLNNNPLLQYELQQVALVEAERNVTKAQLFPNLSAGYFIQSLKGPQDVDGQSVFYDGKPRFQGVMIGLQVPLFPVGIKSRLKASKLQVLSLQKNSLYVKSQLQSQLDQYVKQYGSWRSMLEYYNTQALPNAKTIVNNASISYQNGDIGYLEYLQALQTNLDIQRGYLETINNLNLSVTNIQYLLNL
ncbi:MAG: CusA/CzcA family heavy metal efflux RND transporter [Chitinophagales bacterium]|nr:CusA/CzcA family heavy metal efflux RND transporter [Chitinophagales bacterium]